MRFLLVFFLGTTAAFASDWSHYQNARFGVEIDIPPGFVNDVPEPENGDGLTYHTTGGDAELLVWGTHVTADSFADEADDRLDGEIGQLWQISYVKRSDDGSSLIYSGSKDGRIVYAKSLSACKGTLSVNFRIEYPADQKQNYDAVVSRLASSLKDGPAAACS
ncbi:MAG: hypothetical protein LCH46_11810 [Proteobacteria bacterium]|nr:hypothetical protein [Pseudomonadota bacterium]